MRTQHGIVTGACLLLVIAGIAAVAGRFVTDGGGGYGGVFVPLMLVDLALLAWAFTALRRFRRSGAGALEPLAVSILTLVALLLLALAIGLRG